MRIHNIGNWEIYDNHMKLIDYLIMKTNNNTNFNKFN